MKRLLAVVLATLILSGLGLVGCDGGSGSCGDGESAGITLTVNGSNVEANGTDFYRVTITARDETCQKLPAGTSIQLTLNDAEPEGVGYFSSNNEATVTLPLTDLGASTQVRSSVPGIVLLSARVPDFPLLTGIPRELEFDEPQTTGQCGVTVVAEMPSILADGASSTRITATLTGDDGQPMPNNTPVNFTTTLGTFTGSGDNSFDTTAASGQAEANLKSELLTDPDEATVTASFTCNDAARTSESNDVLVRFVLEMDRPQVVLTSSKSTVLADDVSTVDLTAEVFAAGGARVGAGEQVDFSTDLGTFTENGLATFSGTTDADGKAYATFKGGSLGGLATLTAAVYLDGQNASHQVQINVRQVGFVEFDSASAMKLGVRGSGVNETSQVVFTVKDTSNQPFQGVLVSFSLSVAPGVTLDPLSTLTDASGSAVTTLKSGVQATSVTVTAEAQVGNVRISATSPAFAIEGAKPVNKSMSFVCETLNVGGFNLVGVVTNCSVSLADRYSNKIGFATSVLFNAEAGQIDGSAVTEESGEDKGIAAVTIRTSENVPKDVPPLNNEPRVIDGVLTRNPRDGLVTLIAFTTGEEYFSDDNLNGLRDANESFVDAAEPFVDKNDDGIWNGGEALMDSNQNGVWDPPNGVWDGNTQIWDQTWIVWTGRPVSYGSSDAMGAACSETFHYGVLCPEHPFTYPAPTGFGFAPVCMDGQEQFYYFVGDENLNPPNSTASINAVVSGKFTVAGGNPALPRSVPDSLGTSIELRLVGDLATLRACDESTDLVCYEVAIIGESFMGISGTVVIDGPSSILDQGMGSTSISVTYRQSPGFGNNLSYSYGLPGQFGCF